MISFIHLDEGDTSGETHREVSPQLLFGRTKTDPDDVRLLRKIGQILRYTFTGDSAQRRRMYSDRLAPGGDREGEETLAGLRNGEPQLGEPMYSIGGMARRCQ